MVGRRAVLGLGLAVVAAGCAPPRPAPAGWSYVDDRGVRVTAEAVPRRIIAQVSAAGALGDFGVPVVGTFGSREDARGIDLRGVPDVTGPGYGELDLERTAALQPDLLVSGKYAEFDGLWHLTAEHERRVRALAPTAGVLQSGRSLPETVEGYRALARALGADVGAPRVREAEERFRRAADRLRGIGARMRAEGRSILAIGGTKQEFFVVVPARNPDLDFYVRELGLPITTPARPDTAGGGYFERLSWENAAAYRADVLLWDTRRASLPPEEMLRHPVFAARESAARRRFVAWEAVAPFGPGTCATTMNRLADGLESVLGA